MIHIGFTGSRNGMKPNQLQTFLEVIGDAGLGEDHNEIAFHHGDCVGADEQAHYRVLGNMDIFIHPPTDPKHRAFCTGAKHVSDPKPYILRNHIIVKASDLLIATPATVGEEQRSGTWATIRYANQSDVAFLIIDPYGKKRRTI